MRAEPASQGRRCRSPRSSTVRVGRTYPHAPKPEGNTHTRGFVGDSVELDAIEPNQLRALVEAVIQLHLPRDQFAALKAAEPSERKLIAGLVAMIPAGGAL